MAEFRLSHILLTRKGTMQKLTMKEGQLKMSILFQDNPQQSCWSRNNHIIILSLKNIVINHTEDSIRILSLLNSTPEVLPTKLHMDTNQIEVMCYRERTS